MKTLLTILFTMISYSFVSAAEQPNTAETTDQSLPFTPQTVGNTTVKNAWIRATNGKNAAVFCIFENPEGDRLLKVEADVADSAELHAHVHEGDIVRMRAIDNLPIKDTVVLKPGGLHIMLIDLHQSLKEGDQIPLKLMFEKSGSIVIDVPVLLRSPYIKKA